MHAVLWKALQAAVVRHVTAIGFCLRVKGQNLVLPMLTGQKLRPRYVPGPRIAGVGRAVAVATSL